MAKNIPYFWLKAFCCICVFIQVETKCKDLNFDVTALGHSGFFISWDPHRVKNMVFREGEYSDLMDRNTYLDFTFRAIDEKSNKISTNSENITSEEIFSSSGKYVISKLNENTHYQIYIKCYSLDESKLLNTTGKTGRKSNLSPQKPGIKWYITTSIPDLIPSIRIVWLPCGKSTKCNESVPSTHFSVQFKVLESKHWVESGDVYNNYYYNIDGLFVGRTYEVIITSINSGLKTTSDTEEIFIKPASGPVRDVKAMQLNSTTLRLSWKYPLYQPNQVAWYIVAHIKSKSLRSIASVWYDSVKSHHQRVGANNQDDYEQIVTTNLTLPTEYSSSIFIIPVLDHSSWVHFMDCIGFENWSTYSVIKSVKMRSIKKTLSKQEYSFDYDPKRGKFHYP